MKEVVEERAEKMKTNRSIQSKSSTLYKICQGKRTEGNHLSHQLMRAGFKTDLAEPVKRVEFHGMPEVTQST